MDAADARDALLGDPEGFLKYYPVNIAGPGGVYNAGAVNARNAYIFKKNPDYAPGGIGDDKVGHYGATKPGLLGIGSVNISSFVIDENQPNAGDSAGPIPTLAVPMVNYNSDLAGCRNLGADMTNIPSFMLDGSADLMITGQLSGCTFLWSATVGGMRCCHIRPSGIDPTLPGLAGTRLHNEVSMGGRFAGNALTAVNTFGRNDYDAFATVIGVRVAGQWRLYAQTSPDRGATIDGAWKLYPGTKTRL